MPSSWAACAVLKTDRARGAVRQELFYIVCLAVGFALGWYMKREKVPPGTAERINRIEEANRERRADLAAFVIRIADIREGLESIREKDPGV